MKCENCKHHLKGGETCGLCYCYDRFEPKDYPPYLDNPKERKRITNYDRFKTMSIDELENTLLLEICELTGMSEYEDDGIDKRIPIDCPGDCQICLHEWLREEVKEGETQC